MVHERMQSMLFEMRSARLPGECSAFDNGRAWLCDEKTGGGAGRRRAVRFRG